MRLASTISFIALCAVAASVLAGTKSNTEVVINDTIGRASGSLSSARASDDGLQFIFCELTSGGNMQCRARNSAGELRTCTTSNPDFIKTVQMINAASYVVFSWEGSTCTSMTVRSGSNYMP